ncbi:MAG: branched-chain amino acid ABC transporter ATP-binding protein/permease [Actinobacteria bacterium]|nr:branched-chain amino acid ABC transporter ATP-binding protein/permease [Actinomycetota bacterium]
MKTFLPPSRSRPAIAGIVATAALLTLLTALVTGLGSALSGRTLVVFLLNVCLVCGLQLFIGNSGIVSFGHVAFMGIGAYVTALVTIPPGLKASQVSRLPELLARAQLGQLPTVLLAGLVCAVVAAMLGGGLIRMAEGPMAMATLALLVVAHTLFLNWESVTRGTLGLFGVPNRSTPWVALIAAVLFVAFARLYKESSWGLRVRASREDPLSSGSAGINVIRTRYGAWILSAALMGMAGSLWAASVLAFDPNQFFFDTTFGLLAMLVVGGRASVSGAVAGAAIVTFVSDSLARVEQGVRIGPWLLPRLTGSVQFVIALLIIVTLVWRPEGVFGRGEVEDLFLRSRRRRKAAGEAAAGHETDVSEREGAVEVAAERQELLAAREAPSPRREEPQRERAAPAAGPVVLHAQHVTKRFLGVVALDGVGLEVRSGEILGLIGPNGSGKTTLLNALSGVAAPDGGRVLLFGEDVTAERAYRIAGRRLARTFQNIRLFGHLSVRENIEAAQPSDGTPEEVDDLLAWLHLDAVGAEEAVNLPYGMQRRLEIARAAIRQPGVLLLDEPAAGMNEAESDELLADIRRLRDRLGCAVVVIDHDLRLITQLCDRIHVLDQGRTIALGSPEEVVADPAVVAAYVGGSPTA